MTNGTQPDDEVKEILPPDVGQSDVWHQRQEGAFREIQQVSTSHQLRKMTTDKLEGWIVSFQVV